MEIKNANDAYVWLHAWGHAPRIGIAREAVRGLRMSGAISRAAGNKEMAANYCAAAEVIEASVSVSRAA